MNCFKQKKRQISYKEDDKEGIIDDGWTFDNFIMLNRDHNNFFIKSNIDVNIYIKRNVYLNINNNPFYQENNNSSIINYLNDIFYKCSDYSLSYYEILIILTDIHMIMYNIIGMNIKTKIAIALTNGKTLKIYNCGKNETYITDINNYISIKQIDISYYVEKFLIRNSNFEKNITCLNNNIDSSTINFKNIDNYHYFNTDKELSLFLIFNYNKESDCYRRQYINYKYSIKDIYYTKNYRKNIKPNLKSLFESLRVFNHLYIMSDDLAVNNIISVNFKTNILTQLLILASTHIEINVYNFTTENLESKTIIQPNNKQICYHKILL